MDSPELFIHLGGVLDIMENETMQEAGVNARG